MAINSNVFSQGAGGSVYELEVQTGFMISFMLGLNIPGISGKIKALRQQSSSLGYQTDDLLLKCSGQIRETKILVQIKHNLVISAKGETFKEVLVAAWKDFRNPMLFDPFSDKIFIIKSDLTQDDKNHLNVMLGWSRTKSSAGDFFIETGRIKAKNAYLEIFRSVIEEEFPGELDDGLLFGFCRTLYFLEMDYSQEASVQKANCLSALEHFRIHDSNSAQELWNQLFVKCATGNSSGACYELSSLPEDLSGLLSMNGAAAALDQLNIWSEQNYEVLDMIENQIGSYSLPRAELVEQINVAMNASAAVVIAGNPGMGKSALAQACIKGIRAGHEGMVICFKADELAEGNLRDYFAKHSISYTLKELFALFIGSDRNVVYIDALEKLLEATGTAFAQLLLALKELPSVKLIISCRQSSLALLDLKFLNQIEYTRIDVGELSECEMDLVIEHVPELKAFRENQRLKNLLKIPKYLDFAYRAVKSSGGVDSDIDEEAFKGFLWQTIIENKTNEFLNGLPARRSRIFVDISVKRSKKMQPFVSLDHSDDEAIEKLVKENVIIESAKKGFYSPAHDVLEDWALVSHVDFLFNEHGSGELFFNSLGNEPAMRRAYRLWVDASFKSGDEQKVKFITQQALVITSSSFRGDECLIAIMQSERCGEFFAANRPALVANGFALLLQVIKVMRTACKKNTGDRYTKYYIPTGYGWAAVIALVREQIAEIANNNWQVVYDLLFEWSNIVDYHLGPTTALRDAGLIMLFIVRNHITFGYSRKKDGEEAVKLLVRFTGGIQEELQGILNTQEDGIEDNDDDWEDDRFRSKLIKIILSGYAGKQVAKFLPDKAISLAKEYWMKTSSKVHYPTDDHDRMMMSITHSSSPMDINHYFGLRSEGGRLDYFPASALQTPTYWLLKFHPHLAIEFICELSNWCAENYVVSEFSERDGCEQLTLILSDGTQVQQYGSDLLWSVFRGSVKVSPYLWQSVLMALEKYLLELCHGGSKNYDQVNELIDQLLRTSISVAITGVVSSVYQAYPEFAGGHLASLYSHRAFLRYDIDRFVHEQTNFFLPSFNENTELDKERKESDKLPHRRKYQGGLQNFVTGYCFNYGAANVELFRMFDMHRKLADPNDQLWRKRLDEMDVRTWRITTEYDDGDKKGFLIEPSYGKDIQDFVSDLKIEQSESERDSSHMVWLNKVEKGSLLPDIAKWREIYRGYVSLEHLVLLKHHPGLLAKIGITMLWEELTTDEQQWCEDLGVELVKSMIDRAYDPYGTDRFGSILDLSAMVTAFPMLVFKGSSAHQIEMERLLFCFLTSPFQRNDPQAGDLFKSFAASAWLHDPALADRMLKGVVQFAGFFKQRSSGFQRPRSQEELDAYHKKYIAFVNRAMGKGVKCDLAKIDFSSYSVTYLERAVVLLPPKSDSNLVFDLAKKLTSVIMAHRESRRYGDREERIDYLKIALQYKLSDMILWNSHRMGAGLFNHLLSLAHSTLVLVNQEDFAAYASTFRFARDVIEHIILVADDNFHDDSEEKNSFAVDNFLYAWKVFIRYLFENNISLFGGLLLLDINVKWKKTATSWKPIEKDKAFFILAIKLLGPQYVDSVITLISHIGDEILFKDGFTWLIEHLKKTNSFHEISVYQNINQLMSRGYYNHLDEIMGDQVFLLDFLDMLDVLVSNGSSDAYWIREFMISFTTEDRSITRR